MPRQHTCLGQVPNIWGARQGLYLLPSEMLRDLEILPPRHCEPAVHVCMFSAGSEPSAAGNGDEG